MLRRDGLHRRRGAAAPRHRRGDDRPAARRVRARGAGQDEPRRPAAAHARAGAQRHRPPGARQRAARPLNWSKRLLLPVLARHVAGALSKQHPGLSRQEIAAKMRAELGSTPDEDARRMVDAVLSRIPTDKETTQPVSAWILLAANL